MTDASLSHDAWAVAPGDFPDDGSEEEQARFLLRFAILAPSSHNSQPWRFRIDGDRVEIDADSSRWLRVADADQRELYLSVGCALENLLLAAQCFGYEPRLEVPDGPQDGPAAKVVLGARDPGRHFEDRHLFDAIVRRRTSHEDFTDQGPLEPDTLDTLRRTAADIGVELVSVDGDERAGLARLQEEADEHQMADDAYREELGEWIGSGALGDAWPKARIVQWVVTHFDLGKSEAKDNSQSIRDAAFVGVLVTDADDPAARIQAGRAWERVALAATSLGLATQPISQTLEVPELKERVAALLGLENGTPQHLFRAGHGRARVDHTPRWPLDRFLTHRGQSRG